ncbi:uncharacterized protein [Coffea arabica]|uniref:Uncharacterized protein n=1 Tax=Coffea arabica TaxID=13443 RepID=A0A6P6V7Y2_COFAR|nr:uncharacterized protein LOC113717393 isoform X1 [Coffea arabica]XP_027098023.1 uncharacterized protein LOC113717393 isoform X1 [Coffea arabica]XP_027098024.1 uncharacterized protein LOC113717393 isoform X1 [Coffea arabica]
MPRKLADDEMVTRICSSLREKQTRMANPDAVLMESMDRFVQEFRFLFIFLSYTRAWSDAHKVVPNLDQLVPRIAAAIKECRKILHYAFADNYRGEYYLFYESTCGWKDCWRGVGDCLRMDYCPREPWSLLDVFASLNEQIEMLKQEIRNAYYEHLSSHAFHCQPASSWTGDYRDDFCSSIRWSLQLLSEKLDLVVDTLRKQMKALNGSLYSLKFFIQHPCNDWYHGKVHMMARFGQVAVRTAHVCCLCWSVAEMDLNMEKDVASLLSDLQQKVDLASPEFLGLILEFLEEEECRLTFLDLMLDVKNGLVLHDDLLPLIYCVVKIPKMDNMDVQKFSISIKAVIVEVSNLRQKCNTISIIDFVSLFARVWILNAEIFLTEQQIAVTLLALSLEDYITDSQPFRKG